MFTVKFKDGTTILATSVEESFRPEHDGDTYVALTIQNSDFGTEPDLDTLQNQLSEENISTIQVFIESNTDTPTKTYNGYKYIRYLTERLQPDGKTLLDINITKEDLTV